MLSRPTLLPVPVKPKSAAGSKKKAAVKKAPAKKVASKPKKAAPKKPVAKKSVAKKAPAKKAPAKKAPAKKAPAKKVATKKPAAKKAPAKPVAKKAAPAKPVAKPAAKPVAKAEPAPAVKVEPKVEPPKITLVVPQGLKPKVPSKPLPPLKPRAAGPKPLVVKAGEEPWSKAELNTLRSELEADLQRLRRELANAENDIADLLKDPGDGAGDDQADAGTKTFEREHELSLVNNARDMVLQSERALARIADGSYGVCESCGNPIGKARLQVFPRATLCMLCKQKEERR